ncbi:phosphoglycerate dehydrogenase [Virgibacillus natechei]|uniref:phosphoglycerate dehydrogenase n=1 Tax=Virgibacillus sp. CBA3643 TaxID=2942278 RepID=UPI0035A2D1AD
MEEIISTSRTFGKYSMKPVKLLEEAQYKITYKAGINTEEQMINAIKGKKILIVGVEPVTKRVIEQSPELKVIAKHGIGIDNIDLEAAKKGNVMVVNVPGANQHAVADYVIGLMLSISRGISKSYLDLKNHNWNIQTGNEIYGKTMGVVGTGRIGSEVIRRAAGFNMNILMYDLYKNEQLEEEYNNAHYVSLKKLLKESDYVTIHINLTENTRHFIGMDELNEMKENATLINTSRGGIINEDALYEFLKENKDFSAGLDVFEDEPFSDHPLLSLENFIGTPHNAGYTKEALTEMGTITAENIINILKGKDPLHKVV